MKPKQKRRKKKSKHNITFIAEIINVAERRVCWPGYIRKDDGNRLRDDFAEIRIRFYVNTLIDLNCVRTKALFGASMEMRKTRREQYAKVQGLLIFKTQKYRFSHYFIWYNFVVSPFSAVLRTRCLNWEQPWLWLHSRRHEPNSY